MLSLNQEDEVSPTAGPVRRSTVHKPTGPFEPKSTRDITLGLVPETPTTARPAVPPPVEVPAFSGRSFLELARLQAYSRLSLELEFRTFSDQGILLYNGQTASGSGDFVSLAVRDGYVEFRYNLGSGPVILRSPQRVLPGKFHRLVAKRYLQEGMIALDGQDDVMGRSQGLLKSLDLGQNLFLGHVPDNTGIWENVGVRTGLVGCIRRLKVGRKLLDLRFPTSKDILRAKDIRECTDGPCDWRPCRNGATCLGPPQAFLQLRRPGIIHSAVRRKYRELPGTAYAAERRIGVHAGDLVPGASAAGILLFNGQQQASESCFKLRKTASESFQVLKQSFKEDTLSQSRTFEWFAQFKAGRTSVKDDLHIGRPLSIRNPENALKIKSSIKENPRITIRELSE
ncbi:hypothetical protein LAZ67_7001389 [Cordylochernes scorpioides]|uniref:Laminin G domain-containing protein n=1 Tax=Cordylochernes scorpioides TaxID=51811 RepID=A0ABY6KQH0_9ARAC|nr:hypothetical protein LAZ67_7001389 [Cordylochernes scorpioides]